MNAATLLEYDQWATHQLLPALAGLTPEQFTQESGGELSSIRQQSVHLVSVSDRYRARIMEEPVPEVEFASFKEPADIIAYSAEVAERIAKMIPSLTPERMAQEIRHETRRGVFVLTVEQTVLQIVNHGTYHRGQIACLLKHHGIEPIDTDVIIWVKYKSPN